MIHTMTDYYFIWLISNSEAWTDYTAAYASNIIGCMDKSYHAYHEGVLYVKETYLEKK